MEITDFLHVIEYSIYAEAMFDMSTNWRANWSYDPTRRGHWSVESPVVASRNVSTFLSIIGQVVCRALSAHGYAPLSRVMFGIFY